MCEEKRVCKICNVEKPIEKFQKAKWKDKNYHTYQCSLCLSRRKAKKEKELRLNHSKDYDVSTTCMVNIRTQFKQRSKKSNLNIDYSNLTVDWYRTKLQQQNRCCEICKKSVEEIKKRLVVDHCHTTGKVRGLLCDRCNFILGVIEANWSTENYREYIERYK